MDPRVEKFLSNAEREIDQYNEHENAEEKMLREQRKADFLISLGLYEEDQTKSITEREYFDLPESERSGWYPEYENGILKCYSKSNKIPIQVTDDEYQKICETAQKRDEIKKHGSKQKDGKSELVSSGAKFLRAVAWIIWIGGVIAAIGNSMTTVQGYYSEHTEFSWRLFFPSLLTYLFEGGLVMCFAEALENLQEMRDMLRSLYELIKGKRKN